MWSFHARFSSNNTTRNLIAFDIVNHEFLLDKLNQYDIKGTELQLFKTYLRKREQHAIVSSFS